MEVCIMRGGSAWTGSAFGVVCLMILTAPPSANVATAGERLKCAAAMVLVAQHPGVEAPSVATDVLAQWQAMDRQTTAAGHAPIVGQMVGTPAIMALLAQQCRDNPGQALWQASAQVYLRARAVIDGF
jgi:hypothetical protein